MNLSPRRIFLSVHVSHTLNCVRKLCTVKISPNVLNIIRHGDFHLSEERFLRFKLGYPPCVCPTWGILSLMIGFNLHQSRASDFIALIFKLIVFSFVGGDEYLSSCGQRKSKADGCIKVVRVHIKCYNLIKNKKNIKSHRRECLSSPLFKTVIRLPK